MKGSVFPWAALIALPGAVISFLLKWSMDEGFMPWLTRFQEKSVLKETAVWSSFSFLVGFLIVFRTSQAYNRFWDGCTSTHQMRAEWFEACSSLIAFCRHTGVSRKEVEKFEHILIRLFSMLHAVALAEIEDSSSDNVDHIAAFKYELVDAGSIDPQSLRHIKDSDSRVELVYQWIQKLVVDNVTSGIISIPPPLLSRTFHELANGMCQFHEAIKVSTVPFPFPYAQACDCMLFMQFLMTPLMVTQFVSDPVWAAFFTFVQIFIHWTLNLTAVEIENPFGYDPNDIDAEAMQLELNRHLMLLISPQTQILPVLVETWDPQTFTESPCNKSLSEVWAALDSEEEHMARRTVRSKRWTREGSLTFVSFDEALQHSSRSGKSGSGTDDHFKACQFFDGFHASSERTQDSNSSDKGRSGASLAALTVVAAQMQASKAEVDVSDAQFGQKHLSDDAYYHAKYTGSEREYANPDYDDMEGMRSGDAINRARAAEDGTAGPRSRWALPLRPRPQPAAESHDAAESHGILAQASKRNGCELEGEASSMPAVPPLAGSSPSTNPGVLEGGSSARGARQRLAVDGRQEPLSHPCLPVSTL